ncbi:MAG: type II toxin-antitoxin system mRNA interferase toxin, RelE/StbE family [Candidatus Magasanikbacteria bacterium]|jgi:addiction module RelE/StbE family toxin|nr:type II toxin-antitoxin system mRNA interferase toxin, RelE/StbE family [Candidatus Magasanikbacteria bacterium]
MIIHFHKKFSKQYKRLDNRIQKKIDRVVSTFRIDPFNASLKNHKLSGVMKDKRAISVNGDIRIIFQEFEDYTLVIMFSVGGHERVYK